MSLRSMSLALAFAYLPLFPASADDALTPTRAAYQALKSYADTGVVVHDSGVRHTFKTYYRAPRHFYFEFNMDPKAGGWRYVLWCDGGDFQSWNNYFKQHEVYQQGSGTTLNAFAKLTHNTLGTIAMVPSLLFAGSGLNSVLTELSEPTRVGIEPMGGGTAARLEGIASSVYPASGRVHNRRAVKVWVDTTTQLIVKTFEDTPEGMPPTAKLRTTVTYQPRANPTLDDSTFIFDVPRAR